MQLDVKLKKIGTLVEIDGRVEKDDDFAFMPMIHIGLSTRLRAITATVSWCPYSLMIDA